MARAAGLSLVVAMLALPMRAAQEPSLADILMRAAAYVAAFQKQLSSIVAEETSEQEIKNLYAGMDVSRRRLKSDLLLVRPVGAGATSSSATSSKSTGAQCAIGKSGCRSCSSIRRPARRVSSSASCSRAPATTSAGSCGRSTHH